MEAAIAELQKPFLDERQIAASRTIMGLDTQLIDDGTYLLVEADGMLAGLWRMEPPRHFVWRRPIAGAQRRAPRPREGCSANTRDVHTPAPHT